MSFRKYWQRHPIQLRVTAAFLLVFLPVVLPFIALVQYHKEILRDFGMAYAEMWNVLRKGLRA